MAVSQLLFNNIKEAHAILGCLTFVVLMPLAVFLMAFKNGVPSFWLHVGVQTISLFSLTATAGMGVWMALNGSGFNNYHQIIGLVLLSVTWLQPVGGWIEHSVPSNEGRTIVGYAHIVLGFFIITVGMIQGGLGFMYAGDPTRAEDIAYSVVAGIVWLAVIGAMIYRESKKPKDPKTKLTMA